MLKAAFNALTFLHSRAATLKRLGSPDMYSPCRVTPSNFFRFLRGPEYVTVKGVEFIVPLDSLTGQFYQLLTFDEIPDDGLFSLKFGDLTTDPLNYDAVAADIQVAVRLLAGHENVVVTGDYTDGFTFLFAGFSTSPDLGEVVDSTLEESAVPVVTTFIRGSVVWSVPLRKGDRIIEGSRLWTVDEIIEMHDLGAIVMGYRVRCD